MNKILVLGTGNAQKDLIQYCKDKGMYVIAASNAAGGAAQEFADEFCLNDIVDAEAIKKLAVDKKADIIYSIGSDVAMPTVTGVSAELKLPCFVSYDTALVCNHKNMLRELLNKKGVKGNIPYQMMEDAGEEIKVPFPAVIKPSDSQGQRGVMRVENEDEVRKNFEHALKYSREKKVVLEQYIDGVEISVNVFLEKGELKFYLISDRGIWDEYPGGLIHEHFIPSRYENDELVAGRIKELVVNVLDAIGLTDGPGYFQIKVDKDGIPYLIEVTPRLDGCHMWRLIKHSTGVDLLDASVKLLTGGTFTPPEYKVVPHSLEFFCGKPGTVFTKDNHIVPDNEFISWYYEDGETIKSMNGYFEKCGYVIKRSAGK
ncbi:MAG: ATP-grasp domain-containing protein [Lachnospiraceae bacterium]|nr:ATP-grasp domain-containing protein [Lachnospiraceae bacterium]